MSSYFIGDGNEARPVRRRFATRPGQRSMQRHVGWQAAELVWWQGLHEDLHATTQVLDWLA